MPFVDVLLFLEGFIIIKKGGNLSITTTNKNEDIMNDTLSMSDIYHTLKAVFCTQNIVSNEISQEVIA